MALKQERDEKRKRDEEERKERLRIKKEKAEAALKEKRGSVQGINTGTAYSISLYLCKKHV
jgi:hypothetical protein